MSEENDRRMADFLIEVSRRHAMKIISLMDNPSLSNLIICKRCLKSIQKTVNNNLVTTYRPYQTENMKKFIDEHKGNIERLFDEASSQAQLKLF